MPHLLPSLASICVSSFLLRDCTTTREGCFPADAAWAAREPGNSFVYVVPLMFAKEMIRICKQPIIQSLAADVLTSDSRVHPASREGKETLPFLPG